VNERIKERTKGRIAFFRVSKTLLNFTANLTTGDTLFLFIQISGKNTINLYTH